ncbi:phosphate ABC transporter ATP-binding protein, partial [Lactiplantibacillus plantarum]
MADNTMTTTQRNIMAFDPKDHEIALSTEDLHVFYGKSEAISEGDLQFERYKISALIGPSGSGKSTYLRSLNRMNDRIATVKGKIMYRGLDINSNDI